MAFLDTVSTVLFYVFHFLQVILNELQFTVYKMYFAFLKSILITSPIVLKSQEEERIFKNVLVT